MKEEYSLSSPTPVIILNGLKSIATGFKWTKIDGSPLNFTGKFETTDVDYGYTAFSENKIQGNLKEVISNYKWFRRNEKRRTKSDLYHGTKDINPSQFKLNFKMK